MFTNTHLKPGDRFSDCLQGLNYFSSFYHNATIMNVFSPAPFHRESVIGIVRIITGCLLVFHGAETFDSEKMSMYTGWFVERKYAQPAAWAYAGKVSEFLIGLGYVFGFLTRLASFGAIATFASIIFLLGDRGNVFEGDQHPFLFILLAVVFIGAGPGAWSLDRAISQARGRNK